MWINAWTWTWTLRGARWNGSHAKTIDQVEKLKHIVTFFYGGNLRKQFYSTILKFYRHTTTGFLAKWHLRKERRIQYDFGRTVPRARYIAASKELVSFRCYDNSDVVAALNLYEDSANFLKKTEYQTSANLWKMNAADTKITTWVSASKWSKWQASTSKRDKCVSTTKMHSQKNLP